METIRFASGRDRKLMLLIAFFARYFSRSGSGR